MSPLPTVFFTPWGEGWGEGQGRVRAWGQLFRSGTAAEKPVGPSVPASAPHPNPLPIVKNDGERGMYIGLPRSAEMVPLPLPTVFFTPWGEGWGEGRGRAKPWHRFFATTET